MLAVEEAPIAPVPSRTPTESKENTMRAEGGRERIVLSDTPRRVKRGSRGEGGCSYHAWT